MRSFARSVVCTVALAVSALLLCRTLHGMEAEAAIRLAVACAEDNDLLRVLTQNGIQAARFATGAEAVQAAPAGGGVLVLADGYPAQPTAFDAALLEAAKAKRLRLYVEFPAWLPDQQPGAVRKAQWERAVVVSDAFGDRLKRLRILMIHDCHFLPVKADRPHVVLARVAGLDTAPFGLPKEVHPVLFEHPSGDLLVASTKLSQFVTARYGPKDAWQATWQWILGWIQPGTEVPKLEWTPTVRPTFDRSAVLPAHALEKAVARGIDWHTRARLLVHPSWKGVYDKYGNKYPPVGPRPTDEVPAGDGELGVLEGFTSRIRADGSQDIRWWLRSDSNGESALAFALRSRMDGDARSRTIAGNLLDWVYGSSGFLHNDPARSAYGLLGWAPSHLGVYYGDNDVKAILGCMGTAALLDTDRWDERLLVNILANFRTTGRFGFRSACLNDAALEKLGWRHYWNAGTIHYAPHYEAWIWACYLWLYDKTRFEPLLERTKGGIRRMMAAYPKQWRWTNGIQQERARMLLTLAWLIRVQDTPEHRAWLARIADDLLADQQPSGAFQEEIGEIKMGTLRPPQSNEEYGAHEASLIQQNGDPIADLLYTNNFALFGLIEAAAATGDARLAMAADRLAEFFVRVQARSDVRPELDGAWFRAMDLSRWEYWASNSDWEWGPWCTEVGWTQGWIITGMALRHLKLNLWDLTARSQIGRHMAKHRKVLLPDDAMVAAPPAVQVRHAALDKPVTLAEEADPRYPGCGSASLTDGALGQPNCQSPEWLGFEGTDLEAVVDLGRVTAIHRLGANFLEEIPMGVFLPREVEFAVSDDGRSFRPLGKGQVSGSLRPLAREGQGVRGQPKTEIFVLDPKGAAGRYVKFRAVNLGTIPDGHPGRGRKAWLFADEILVNPTP